MKAGFGLRIIARSAGAVRLAPKSPHENQQVRSAARERWRRAEFFDLEEDVK